ncbi:pectinesterase family protein [Paenibacillus puerhi]|uniref:pectinesterase family protein n=1 Tax=Paenibacillus puerhi TaxID=2692622 RepID=UPI00135B8595|nr:pectinesterase family protein [Paenibacillus puerhi]
MKPRYEKGGGKMKKWFLIGISLLVGLQAAPVMTHAADTAGASAVIQALPQTLAHPSGLKAAPGDGKVALSWEPVEGAAAYSVKRSEIHGGPYVSIADGINVPSYEDATAVNGTAYYYTVTAAGIAGAGESMISREAKAVPYAAASGVPAKPTGYAAAAGEGSVTLTWDPVPGAAAYSVGRSTESGGPYTTIASGLETTVYEDLSMTNSMSYYYVVQAENSSGAGPQTDEIHVVPARPIIVAQDGIGDYTTIQEAVNAIPAGSSGRTVIYIGPGIYRERVTVSAPRVSLVGAGRDQTKIVFNLSAATSPGSALNGATLTVTGNQFTASNLTVENDAPIAEGQAVAVMINADQSVFENVMLLGYQDTLYTGIPAASPRIGRHYFRNSVIQGRTDFIYGPATAAVFDHVDAISINEPGAGSGGYVTAAATKQPSDPGLVFLHSRLLKDGSTAGLHYLGRPWQDYPTVRFVDTWMDDHIHPEGWTTMQVEPSYFGEYRSTGPGASPGTRVLSTSMSAEEASALTLPRLFSGWDPSKRMILPKGMPQVTAIKAPAQPDGQGEAYTKPVVVSFDISHNEYGAYRTEYRVNGGDWTPYTMEFEISAEGLNEVEYRLLDDTGIAGTTRKLSIRIDPNAVLRVPAFPGAEGGAMYATGGRGQSVYEVTTLEDYDPTKSEPAIPGSLRDAVSQDNRTIVFRVSGTIHLKHELKMSHNNLTLAGQTAPGDGIAISGYPVTIGGDNLIVRYLRFRAGISQLGDSANVGGNNIIIDHCSFSWSSDETFSLKEHRNITVQWSLVSNSLNQSIHGKGSHGYGGIWGGTNVTYHHNLIVNHSNRNPRFDRQVDPDEYPTKIDYRNNVVYNWGFNSAYGGEQATSINMINNYYKPGPSTFDGVKKRLVNPSSQMAGSWYIDGNVIEGFPEHSADNWMDSVHPDFGMDSLTRLLKPAVVPGADDPIGGPVATQSAEEAYASVLQQVGAILPKRDSLDARIVSDVRNGTGKIVNTIASDGGLPVLNSVSAPQDSDHDGMPDEWEVARGLNPHDPADGNADQTGDGFTNLEKYMNSLGTTGSQNPHVRLENVTMHQMFTEGEDIVLSAEASDSDGTVAKVEFYDGDIFLGEAAEAPFQLTWRNAAEGQHMAYAKAIDDTGTMTLSSGIILHVNRPASTGSWQSQDIGEVPIPGTASLTGTELKVKGSGQIDARNRDSFQYTYQQVQGDFELIANVSFASEIDNQVKAGLMVRESLQPDSPSTMLALSMDPAYEGKYALWLHRPARGGASVKERIDGARISAPYWFKLAREGNVLAGYVSQDGSSWGRIGSAEVSWPEQVYLGFAVDAAKSTSNSDYLTAASFTGVAFNRAPAFTVDNPAVEQVEIPVYTVTGTMTDSGRLTVTNNGQPAAGPLDLLAGDRFAEQIALTEGMNTIQISAYDPEAPGGLVQTRTLTVTYIKRAPVITLTEALPEIVSSPSYTLRASVDKSTAVTVTLNGTLLMEAVPQTAGAAFHVPLSLKEGINELSLTAVDQYGIATTDLYSLIYRKDWGQGLFTVSGVAFTDLDGRPLSGLKRGQDTYVSANFHNNSAVGQNGVLVLGLYDRRDRLVRYAMMEQTVPAGSDRTFQALMNVPKEGNGYRLKALVWEDFITRKQVSNDLVVQEEDRH